MKKMMLMVGFLVSALALGATDSRQWKAAVAEGWFDVAENWMSSLPPTVPTDAAKIYPNENTSYRIYVPTMAPLFGGFRSFTRPGSTLELIGTNRDESVSVFTMPKLESGTHIQYPLAVYDNQSNGYMLFYLNADATANATVSWTNAYFKATEQDGRYDLTIGGGFLNILDPDGTVTNKSDIRMASYSGVGHRELNATFNGDGVRAYGLSQFAKADRSSVTFSRGTHEFVDGFSVNFGAEVAQTNETTVSGSAVVTCRSATFGRGALTKGLCKLTIRDSGVLDLLRGTSAIFSGNTQVVVEDSGRLALPGAVTFGSDASDSVTSLSLSGAGSSVCVGNQSGKSFALLLIGSGSPGRLDVSDGVLSGEGGLYLAVGLDAAQGNAKSVCNVSGGRLEAFGGDPGIDISGNSPAEMNVSGGEVISCDLRLGIREPTVANTVALFRQTGGTVTLTNNSSVRVCVNNSAKRIGRLVLDGGVLEACQIYGEKTVAAGYAGTGTLEANGGTIRPNAAVKKAASTVNFLRNLDSAKLGPKGLTVDTPYDIEIGQRFEDADAPGRLVKTGAGKLTLTGAGSTQSHLDVAAGTVVLGASATLDSAVTVTNGAVFDVSSAGVQSLAGLVLGNATSAGRLVATTATRLTLASAPSFPQAEIMLSGAVAVGTYPILSTTAAVSAAVKEQWRKAWLASDRPAGQVLAFDVSEAEGVTSFNLVVTTAVVPSRIVSWPWGETELGADAVVTFGENVSEVLLNDETVVGTIAFPDRAGSWTLGGSGSLRIADTGMLGGIEVKSGYQTVNIPVFFDGDIIVNVTNGACLRFEKPVYGDRLVKRGLGRLVLADPNSVLRKGLEDRDGTIVWTDGLVVLPKLYVNSDYHSHAIILDNDADVIAESFSAPHGAPIKRGVGTLVLSGKGTETISIASTSGGFGSYANPAGAALNFDSETTVPGRGFGGFNVFEGEVVLCGKGTEHPTFWGQYSIQAGIRSTNAVEKAPGLVIDNARLELRDVSQNPVTLFIAANAYTNEYPVGAVSPYVYVTNNATLSVYGLDVGRLVSGGGIDLSPQFLVSDGSSLVGERSLYLNRRPGCSVSLSVTRESSFSVGANEVSCAGPTVAEFTDMSSFAGALRLGAGMDGRWAFRSGSSFVPTGFVQEGTPSDSSLVFDGGFWKAGADDADIRLSGGLNVKLVAEGDGLVLDVPAAKTWRLYQKVQGPGAVVKTGMGLLRFECQSAFDETGTQELTPADTATLACVGGVYIEEGTVSFAAGAGRGPISGPGTVVGSTLADPIVRVALDAAGYADAAPTFDACTLNGTVTVDFGRGREVPAFDPQNLGEIVVARLVNGTVFDASRWRSRGAGKGVRATFTCADGVVKAKLYSVGFQIIIR